MTLLEIFFIVSGIIILLLGIDIAKKEKFNALHFFVFLLIGFGLLVFSLFPWVLTAVGNAFGLQRGADLLVYVSIIFLVYFVLLLLRKIEQNRSDITKLVREMAIQNSSKKELWNKEVFVIPSYNEWWVIWWVLEEVIIAWIKDIIVINDGSTDNSRTILESFWDKIFVLDHYKNRGQGAALETGFEYVRRYGWDLWHVVTFDSDGQHNIRDLETFRKYANNEVDILLGSRFLKASSTNIALWRKIMLKCAIIFTFFLSHIRLSDTHNGFRYIRKNTLKDISITIDGMWHASEIIDIISSKRLRYKEVPIVIKYTEYSMQKWQKSWNFIRVFFNVMWNKFFR